MYKSNISSNNLFHFTKEFDTIISILKNGFYPRVAFEDISFMLPNYETYFVGIPMVCFTDMPLELSENHREQYGKYGLGINKEWGIKNGVSPILYILKDSGAYKAFNHMQYVSAENAIKIDNLLSSIKSNASYEEKNSNSINAMIDFLNFSGYMKVYSEDPFDDNTKPFYDEREWRYVVPFTDDIKYQNGLSNRLLNMEIDNQNKIDELNKYLETHYPLKFTYEDIDSIIVPKDENVQTIIKKMMESSLLNYDGYIKKIQQI